MIRQLVLLACFSVVPLAANAALVTFTMTPGEFGSSAVFTASGTDNGVNFTASLTVNAGGGLNLITDGNGVGIFSSTTRINTGDTLDFLTPVITSSTGAVTFDNFVSVDVNGFQAGDSGSANGVALTADSTVPIGVPASFTVAGISDAFGTDAGFQVASVTASFTGTAAVPEPSSLALCGLVGLAGVMRRRRA